jgi:hypothetical protein
MEHLRATFRMIPKSDFSDLALTHLCFQHYGHSQLLQMNALPSEIPNQTMQQ